MRNQYALLVVAAGLATLLTACTSDSSSSSSTPTSSSSAVSSTESAPSSTVSRSTSASSPRTTSAGLSGSGTSSGSAASSGAVDTAAAEAYCEQQGGTVQDRRAYWGTNGDESSWLALAGDVAMCRFQTDDEAKSRIYVDLTTLTSKEPTLAGLAYQSKVPMPSVTGGANPATGYCSKELGGSSTFGAVGTAGGGWVAEDDPDDVVVALCVFPDQSFIDEWGLAYHSNGEIRGKDLTTVMQYQTAELPPVFASGAAAEGSGSTTAPLPSGVSSSSSAPTTVVTPTS